MAEGIPRGPFLIPIPECVILSRLGTVPGDETDRVSKCSGSSIPIRVSGPRRLWITRTAARSLSNDSSAPRASDVWSEAPRCSGPSAAAGQYGHHRL